MNDINHSDPPMDPRIKELLDALRETPPRDPEAVRGGRARFLAEVDELFSEPTRPIAPGRNHQAAEEKGSKWWSGLASLRPRLAILQPRLAFTTVFVALAIVLLLFGGMGATAYAAQVALPGDALYPLKTGLEDTQVKLVGDAAQQGQMHLDFAERRLDEIASLIAQGRFDDIGVATSEFEAHVQQAINALETLTTGDPQRANALAVQISSALTRYAQVLRGMLTEVPETVKPAMEKAILTSEEESGEIEFTGTIESMVPGGIQIDGQFVKITSLTEIEGALAVGAVVKVHALEEADGELVAREIEVTAGVGADEDENANDNEGDDDLNENEDDDNEDQADDDLNGDEDDDLNENEAGDDDLNENDDEDVNQNVNLNDNDDDDDDENNNDGSDDNNNDNDGDDDDGDDDENESDGGDDD